MAGGTWARYARAVRYAVGNNDIGNGGGLVQRVMNGNGCYSHARVGEMRRQTGVAANNMKC